MVEDKEDKNMPKGLVMLPSALAQTPNIPDEQ